MIKNQNIIITAFIFLLLSFQACTSGQKKLNDEITAKEKALYSDSSMVPDAAKAREVISLYISYTEKFPDDTTCASYLFKAGDISSKINETQQAIDIFGSLLNKYPDHQNAPYALFLQGFIYENQVGDPLKARPYYEAFLKNYPDHPIAGDVSFSLENLGKSPEELIREFENKLQLQDSAATVDSNAVAASE